MKWLPKHELHEGEWWDCWLMAYPSVREHMTHSDEGHPQEEVTTAPIPIMPAVVDLLTRLEAEGIHSWIDGGWAVDALLGEETRPHRDLDVVVQEKDVFHVRRVLEDCGYTDRVDDETMPWNFVMGDAAGHEVDLHVIVFDVYGNGMYGPAERGLSYPADSLTGRGVIGGYPVQCISPEWLVQFHTGYEFDEQDVRDVLALHKRFGVPLPPEYLPYAGWSKA